MLPFDDAGNLRALDGPPDEFEAADEDLRALVGDELAAMARRFGDVPAAVGHAHLVAIGTAWGEGRDELVRSDATVKRVHRAKLARRSTGLVAAGVLATLGLATGLAATELLPKPAAQVAAAVSEALGIPVPHSVQVAAGRVPAASDNDLPPGRIVTPGVDDADEFATGAPAAGRPANPVPTTVPATTVPATSVPATTGTTVGPRLSVNQPGTVDDSVTTTSVAPADPVADPCAAPPTTAPPPDDTAPPPPPTAGDDPTAPADDVAAEPASTANAAPAQTGPAPDTGGADPDDPPAPAPYQNPPTTLDPAPPTAAPPVTTPPSTPATDPPTGECGSSDPGAVEPGSGTSASDTTDGAPPPADPTAANDP
jgi:hypothetical protein